eukprot:2801407-Prymnesium_polylepis.2
MSTTPLAACSAAWDAVAKSSATLTRRACAATASSHWRASASSQSKRVSDAPPSAGDMPSPSPELCLRLIVAVMQCAARDTRLVCLRGVACVHRYSYGS